MGGGGGEGEGAQRQRLSTAQAREDKPVVTPSFCFHCQFKGLALVTDTPKVAIV